jgi:hypothetical protein
MGDMTNRTRPPAGTTGAGGTGQLSAADHAALDAAAASAPLEGVEIPASHRRLAAAYLAGEIDGSTYRARAGALIAGDLGL